MRTSRNSLRLRCLGYNRQFISTDNLTSERPFSNFFVRTTTHLVLTSSWWSRCCAAGQSSGQEIASCVSSSPKTDDTVSSITITSWSRRQSWRTSSSTNSWWITSRGLQSRQGNAWESSLNPFTKDYIFSEEGNHISIFSLVTGHNIHPIWVMVMQSLSQNRNLLFYKTPCKYATIYYFP